MGSSIIKYIDTAALVAYLDKYSALSGGMNAAIVPYLNTGGELLASFVQSNAAMPWPLSRITDPDDSTKKKAIVTPDWSKNIGDIADVVRLMGWALQRKRAANVLPWTAGALIVGKKASVPSPGPRPSLRQGDALLDYIDDLIDVWPRTDMDNVQACWDIELTSRAMLNAMLAGNPGDGTGGKNELPPGGG